MPNFLIFIGNLYFTILKLLPSIKGRYTFFLNLLRAALISVSNFNGIYKSIEFGFKIFIMSIKTLFIFLSLSLF